MSAPEEARTDGRQPGSGDRAQTETVGFVLVIGMVLVGSLAVVVLGGMALGDTEDQLSEERAEKALTQIDSKGALVALGESDVHDVSFGAGANDRDDISVEEDNGWMRVTVTNISKQNEIEVMNLTLGALVYDGGDVRLGYQGGGVWRADRNGGKMISPPEFHYRDATLTLPAITVSGDGVLNDEATIERESIEKMFPDDDNDELSNPLDRHIVNITVGSEFYRGWSRYFSQRTDGDVDLDPDNETARLTLVSPIGEVTVEGALAGQKSSGQLKIQGNPHHPCSNSGSHPPYIDSFNSSQGSYCDQYDPDEANDGDDLTFGGDIVTDGNAGEIHGNLVSGGSLDLAGQMDYYGNFSYTDDCSVSGGPVKNCEDAQEDGYVVEEIDGVEASDAVDFVVENTVEQLRDTINETTFTDGDVLSEANYYTEEIDLSDDEIVFDTSDNDIDVGVNDTMQLHDDSNITVTGDGEVNIYVDGVDGEDDLRVHDSVVLTQNNSASQMTVLGDENFVGKVVDEGEFSGVIYAPAGDEGDGEVVVDRQGTIYGAVVTGDMTLGEPSGGVGGSVHFDTELEDQQVIPPDKTIIPVTFLHITENHISISS